MEHLLNQAILKRYTTYDPLTGLFYNIIGELISKPALDGHYVRVTVLGKRYYAHRLVWLYIHGEMPDYIDHINGDRQDNRLVNLRKSTMSQNQANRKELVRGIEKHGRKYRARIEVRGDRVELGSFETIEEAYNAYHVAADKFFGEFARINRESGF